MTYFMIDSGNRIYRPAKKVPSEVGAFSSETELFKVTSNWPIARLAVIWNNLPGAAPVTRFKDRKIAVGRIWRALQAAKSSENGGACQEMVETGRKDPTQPQSAVKGTKTEQIIALLKTPAGASLKSIMEATGWQSHSVRGFVSAQLIKRMGLQVKSIKRAGERVYRILR